MAELQPQRLADEGGHLAAGDQKICRLEAWHFWFVSRRRLVDRIIERHFGAVRSVLDVGCGTGSLVVALGRAERRVVGLDVRLVLGMVPAFPLLWGERDIAAGHRRRYRQGHVRRLVAEAGFAPLEIRYFQFTLFPVLALMRLLGGRRRIVSDFEERPGVLNGALRAINQAEVSLSRVVRWPWGSSLVFVGRKISP